MESSPTISSAKTLSYAQRKSIALRAMHRRQPLSEIAKTHQVSRKFVYKQPALTHQATAHQKSIS